MNYRYIICYLNICGDHYSEKYILFLLIIICNTNISAKELARPESIGGDYLLEASLGFVSEEGETLYDFGLEVETFIDALKHQCAIGLSFEVEDLDGELTYFAEGLASFYYHHFKFFISTGTLFGPRDFKEWKTRFGLGHEFFIKKDYILIPAITMDRLESESYFGFNLGFAKEF